MKKKKQYQHPAMIIVKLSGKNLLMQSTGGDGPAGVRAHRCDIDWEEE